MTGDICVSHVCSVVHSCGFDVFITHFLYRNSILTFGSLTSERLKGFFLHLFLTFYILSSCLGNMMTSSEMKPLTDLRCTCVLSLVAQHLMRQRFMCISCRAPTQQTSRYDAKARSARGYASVHTFNLIKTFKIIQGKYIYTSVYSFFCHNSWWAWTKVNFLGCKYSLCVEMQQCLQEACSQKHMTWYMQLVCVSIDTFMFSSWHDDKKRRVKSQWQDRAGVYK